MKKILIILLVLILLVAGGLWYALQPRTLDVSYTQEDLKSARGKLALTYETLPAPVDGKTIVVAGSHPVDQTFTSQELTALADSRHSQYGHFPFRNVQIRINPDGSVEGTAIVNYPDAADYLLQLGVSREDIEWGMKTFNIPNAPLPVYLKVAGSVTQNQSNITVAQAEIARIPVPQELISQYGPMLNTLVNDVIKARQPSYNIDTLEVVDGKVHFAGTGPDIEKTVRSVSR